MRHVLVLAAAAAALAGCGANGPEKLPAACTAGPQPLLRALSSAPGAVRIDGVSISHCFNRQASSADVQVVGGGLLAAAQQLGDRAASDPAGDAALRLGYLIGAAERGVRRNGVAGELLRRLEQEQGSLPGRSAAFARGLRAGRATG
jgi:hypothetical protein